MDLQPAQPDELYDQYKIEIAIALNSFDPSNIMSEEPLLEFKKGEKILIDRAQRS